jgi:hypothetical protein
MAYVQNVDPIQYSMILYPTQSSLCGPAELLYHIRNSGLLTDLAKAVVRGIKYVTDIGDRRHSFKFQHEL